MKYSLPPIEELAPIFMDEKLTIEYLIFKNIIKTEINCPNCENISKLKINRKSYRCSLYTCRKEVSILFGSFFSKSKVKINTLLFFGYFWLAKASHTQISTFLNLSEHTVTEYLKYFKELIADSLDEEDFIIGGVGIKVQIDECKIGKRKYNRGHHVEGVWLLGGVEETLERKVFIKIITNRNQETLASLISRHVAPGSIIITDCWRGYLNLPTLGFEHLTVNHSLEFVNEITGACTNTIEGTWNALKNDIPVRNRTRFCENSLLEFIWRRKNNNNLWNSFILALAEVFYY